MSKLINLKGMNSKQKIIFGIMVVIILILLIWILRLSREEKRVKKYALVEDYSKVQNASYFSIQGDITYDRQLYWDLNDIISGFISSVRYRDSKKNYTIDTYFSALTDEYQFYLGESKYEELANTFINKFKFKGVQEVSYKTTNIINKIYELPNNMYLCELVGHNDQKANIGIVLNKDVKTFKIFYIE